MTTDPMTTENHRSSGRRRPSAFAAVLVTGALASLLCAPSAPAQDDGVTGSFTGELRLGFRTVDVNGAERKYDEDYNLQDGPRLFDFRVGFVPEAGARKLVDRVDIRATNLGGDPFESLSLSARKFGSYDFRYDRRVSQYFYNDLFATAGDFHTFDYQRVQDRAHLDIDVGADARFYISFNRFTRVGESTTTLDLQRDEFELDRPIDESVNDYLAGFEYKWDKVTLTLEEQLQRLDNSVSTFLPGQSQGEDAEDSAVLDFFFLDQPYKIDTYRSTVRLQAQPHERFLVRAAATVLDLDLDVTANESSQGSDFRGNPFSTDVTGAGSIQQNSDLYDVDLSYRVTDRVAVVGGVRSYSLDQDGDFLFGTQLNRGLWNLDTTSLDLGVEIAVSDELSLTGGVIHEERDVERADAEGGPLSELETETTEQDGFFGNVGWRPNKAFRLDLAYDAGSLDDPFTLASPTDRQRISLRGRYQLDNGWSIHGNYILRSFENDNSGWKSDYDKADVSLNYRSESLNGGFGWGRIDIDRSILQLVLFGTQEQPRDIDYSARSDFLSGHLRWRIDERWTVGGNGRLYQNDGSFALERNDYGVYGELNLDAYALRLGYRTVDYDEDAFNFDDYDADILEASVGYRW
jgi:hypothetical protein